MTVKTSPEEGAIMLTDEQIDSLVDINSADIKGEYGTAEWRRNYVRALLSASRPAAPAQSGEPRNGLTVDQEREIAERAELNYPTIAKCPGCTEFDGDASEVHFVQGCAGCQARMQKVAGFGPLYTAPQPTQPAKGGEAELPAWFETFLTNVCEIPDRNSPDNEPDAIVATLEELKSCALNAIEQQPSQPVEVGDTAKNALGWFVHNGATHTLEAAAAASRTPAALAYAASQQAFLRLERICRAHGYNYQCVLHDWLEQALNGASQQSAVVLDDERACDAAYEAWTKSPDFRRYQKSGFDAGWQARAEISTDKKLGAIIRP